MRRSGVRVLAVAVVQALAEWRAQRWLARLMDQVGTPGLAVEVCLKKCTSWGSKYPATGGDLRVILS